MRLPQRHRQAIDDARKTLSNTAARETIVTAFVEWWREPSHEQSDKSGARIRPPTAPLADALRVAGMVEAADFALGPWLRTASIDPGMWSFAILLGESFVDPFLDAIRVGGWRAPHLFNLDTFGAWEAFDGALRDRLRVDVCASDAALARLRLSVESAKANPAGSMPPDDHYRAHLEDKVRRYQRQPEVDDAWSKPSDVPAWPEHAFLWDVLVDVRPKDTMALLVQLPLPDIMRGCFVNDGLTQRPQDIARLLDIAPTAFVGDSFQVGGAMTVVLLDFASSSIESTAHNADGSLILVPRDKPELLAPAEARCKAATTALMDALFRRTDAVPLAWAWLERLVSDVRLRSVPSVGSGGVALNIPMWPIVALAQRLNWRADYQAWVTRRERIWRVYRLSAVLAVATFGQDADADRAAFAVEWALLEADMEYLALERAYKDNRDVVATIGGHAVCTFHDSAGWTTGVWSKLRRIREQNWRIGVGGGNKNNKADLVVLWGLAALAILPEREPRMLLWASIEQLVRDVWQTDRFGYSPNSPVMLTRLFQSFEPDIRTGSESVERQLTRVLLPYIEADGGFLMMILNLIDQGWLVEQLCDAVAVAGFDLTLLLSQFIDMKQRVLNLPQADKDYIANLQRLGELLK